MSDNTGIEWADATWNPIIGCTKVSAGCDNCYAIRTAHRMTNNPNLKISTAYAGTELNGDWTDQINLLPDRLDIPLRWRKPRRIFVNSQSDLFHKNVPDEFIARVFAVMAAAYTHTFQVLTKRPARMRSLLSSPEFVDLFDREYCRIPDWAPRWPDNDWMPAGHNDHLSQGPLSNVWLGTSVEDQKWADIRIPLLEGTPAAVRFLSLEPLLGPVDLSAWVMPHSAECKASDEPPWCVCSPPVFERIGWVIVGGESGPGARAMNPNWVRSLREQCVAAGIPFHFKQWGEWAPAEVDTEFNSVTRVGKRSAGRVLDGRTWDQYPQGVAR